jgi:hypothetical protein
VGERGFEVSVDEVTAGAWLRAHAQDAPPVLLDAMIAALPAERSDSVADALAEAALGLYRGLLHTAGGREDALPLLAADALLTHALQAQAETDPDGIDAFNRRWGAGGALALLTPDRPAS